MIFFKFRVFTFGIGSGASTTLVNGLAKAGGGTSEFIKEGERMQPKVRNNSAYHTSLNIYCTLSISTLTNFTPLTTPEQWGKGATILEEV